MGHAGSSTSHRAHLRAPMRGPQLGHAAYSPLEEAPLDILEEVLSMLNFEDLKRMSLVNKDVNAYLNRRLWSTCHLDRRGTLLLLTQQPFSEHLVITDAGVHGVDIVSAARGLARDPIRAKCVESLELVWLRPFHHILTSTPKLSASIPLRLALAALPNLSTLRIHCYKANWRSMAKALCRRKPFLPELPFRLTKISCTERLVDLIHPFLMEQSGIQDFTVEPQACEGISSSCHWDWGHHYCKIPQFQHSQDSPTDNTRSAFTCLPQGTLPNLRTYSVLLEYSDMRQLGVRPGFYNEEVPPFGSDLRAPKCDLLKRNLQSLPPLVSLSLEIGTPIFPPSSAIWWGSTNGWMPRRDILAIELLIYLCEEILPSLQELIIARRPVPIGFSKQGRRALLTESLVFRRVPVEQLVGAKDFGSDDLLKRFLTCFPEYLHRGNPALQRFAAPFPVRKLTIPVIEGQSWGWLLDATYSATPVVSAGQCRPYTIHHGFEPHLYGPYNVIPV